MPDPEDKKTTKNYLETDTDEDVEIKYKESPFERYQHKISTSFKTVLVGFFILFMAFILVGYGEGLIAERKLVRQLPVTPLEKVTEDSGMIEIYGKPIFYCENSPVCPENVYIKTVTEKYNGETWDVVKEEEEFFAFPLGDVLVRGGNSKPIFNLEHSKKIEEIENPQQGDERKITYSVNNQQYLTVIGSIEGGIIEGGDSFIISNMDDDSIVDELVARQNNVWWFVKVSAWILMTIGFVAVLLPIVRFVDIFPDFGWLVIGAFAGFAFILSTLIVFLTTIILRYWWLMFVVMFVVIVVLIRIRFKRKKIHVNF